MIEYDDIIKDSPFIANHLITLSKTHDFFMNKHIKSGTDILPSQYYMLLFLYYDMGINQSDIAKACLMDRSGVSRAFKDFEEKGLIIREVDESIKRAYKITLTKKGNLILFIEDNRNDICEFGKLLDDIGLDSFYLYKYLEKNYTTNYAELFNINRYEAYLQETKHNNIKTRELLLSNRNIG